MVLLDEPPGDDRQSCSSTPSPPPTTPPLSINRLLALYPRERLLIHPLRRTDRQPDLLGCRIHSHYEDADGADADGAGADENARATSKSDRLAAFLAERLNFQMHNEKLADTIARLLQPLGGRISIELNRRVGLYFNRHSCAHITFRHLSVSIRRPVPEIITLACLDYNEAMLVRKTHFRPRPNGRYTNWQGIQRSYILERLHTPADPQRDPLLVALAIALAQQDRRHAAQPLPSNSSFTVRILATGDGRPKPVNLYVAHVKASFLDRLDFPSQEPAIDSGLDIDHWHIPAEPFQTLPQRVCQTLKPDGYGKTHLKNLSESSGKVGKKKKRDDASDGRISNLKKEGIS